MSESTEIETTRPAPGGVDRRTIIKRLAAAGICAPIATHLLHTGSAQAAHSLLSPGELAAGLDALDLDRAVPALAAYTMFRLEPGDLPWKNLDLEVRKGQQLTVLLSGRWWIARELDIWVEPGLAFFARVGDDNPVYNPQKNTGTFSASRDGRVSIARAIGEWSDSDAKTVATPEAIYTAAEGLIEGVALVWDGDAEKGLKALQARGDIGGLIDAEINRLQTEPPTPKGWYPMYVTGNPGIYSSCSDGQICCETHKNACLLKTDVSMPLAPGAQLDWRWIVEEIPAAMSEDQLLHHDYLSIAVEFDDGQDLTYMWSVDLPQGHVFRCPIPSWQAIETHMVVRTGRDELGQWLAERRDVYEDYKAHIGGEARQIVAIWLIALSFFQRGTGRARYADIVLSGAGETVRVT